MEVRSKLTQGHDQNQSHGEPKNSGRLPFQGLRRGIGVSIFLVLLCYASAFVVFGGASFLLARSELSPQFKSFVVWFELGAWVLGSVALIFYTSPMWARWLIPSRLLENRNLKIQIESLFSRAGLKSPQIFELSEFKELSPTEPRAFVAGMRQGQGFFRPALFLSSSLINKLEPAQLEAVILHEASHLALSHATKRVLYGAGAAVCCFVSAFSIFMVAVLALSPVLRVMLAPWLMIGTFFLALYFQIRAVNWQSRKQEFEADSNAVSRLGADPVALAEAIGILSGTESKSKSARANFWTRFSTGSTHPSGAERTHAIEAYGQTLPVRNIA